MRFTLTVCFMKSSCCSIADLAAGIILLLATTGCATFNSEWKRAAATPVPADDIIGRWGGSWLSDKNGHHGRLRCLVARLDEHRYRARYKATWWKVFRFGYTVTMQAEKSDHVLRFEGEADLGWLAGGVYRYDGQATPASFFSTYKSKYDHGTFQMKRPE